MVVTIDDISLKIQAVLSEVNFLKPSYSIDNPLSTETIITPDQKLYNTVVNIVEMATTLLTLATYKDEHINFLKKSNELRELLIIAIQEASDANDFFKKMCLDCLNFVIEPLVSSVQEFIRNNLFLTAHNFSKESLAISEKDDNDGEHEVSIAPFPNDNADEITLPKVNAIIMENVKKIKKNNIPATTETLAIYFIMINYYKEIYDKINDEPKSLSENKSFREMFQYEKLLDILSAALNFQTKIKNENLIADCLEKVATNPGKTTIEKVQNYLATERQDYRIIAPIIIEFIESFFKEKQVNVVAAMPELYNAVIAALCINNPLLSNNRAISLQLLQSCYEEVVLFDPFVPDENLPFIFFSFSAHNTITAEDYSKTKKIIKNEENIKENLIYQAALDFLRNSSGNTLFFTAWNKKWKTDKKFAVSAVGCLFLIELIIVGGLQAGIASQAPNSNESAHSLLYAQIFILILSICHGTCIVPPLVRGCHSLLAMRGIDEIIGQNLPLSLQQQFKKAISEAGDQRQLRYALYKILSDKDTYIELLDFINAKNELPEGIELVIHPNRPISRVGDLVLR